MTAVGTLAGTPVLLEGETEYEQNTMVFHPIQYVQFSPLRNALLIYIVG